MNGNESDLLISRVVDREDQPADWVRLQYLAGENRELKEELFVALHEDALLRGAVSRALDVADRVELAPSASCSVPVACRAHRFQAFVNWSGWLAAAILALVWMATDPRMKRPSMVPQASDQGPGSRSFAGTEVPAAPVPGSSDLPAAARLASDEVVRELPDVMVETRPIPGSSQVEVFYLRRVLERTVVNGAFTLGHDENGQPLKTSVDLTRFGPPRSY